MRGGVEILARRGTPCGDSNAVAPRLTTPSYSCSMVLYLQDGRGGALKITGVNLPPSGGATAAVLGTLTAPGPDHICAGTRTGHLLCGDFNRPSWGAEYRIKTGSHGIRELPDPEGGARSSAHGLDRFSRLPGVDVPMAFAPSSFPSPSNEE